MGSCLMEHSLEFNADGAIIIMLVEGMDAQKGLTEDPAVVLGKEGGREGGREGGEGGGKGLNPR